MRRTRTSGLYSHGHRIQQRLYNTKFLTPARSYIEELQNSLNEKLMLRPAYTIYDTIQPTQSHLLVTTLADHLPRECLPDKLSRFGNLEAPKESLLPLPHGHHLVYFPPPHTEHDLLPDGTDMQHSPGDPYVRRMWAGGSIVFNNQLFGNNEYKACVERISEVAVKGSKEGDERIYVDIERRVSGLDVDRKPLLKPDIIEMRKLVFMRQKSVAQIQQEREKKSEQRKRREVTHKPDFSIVLTPTPSLLFRFSALTFNAHRIHFDPQYCREVEGHKNILVHGPLSLILMLYVLRTQLRPHETITRLDYRNLAPLYAGQQLKVCVRRNTGANPDKLEVWIEGKDGGYAVKGTTTTEWRGCP